MKALNKLSLIWIACLLTVGNSFADDYLQTLFVPKAVKPPELDGQIKDGEWAGGAKSGPFVLLDGSTNAASEQTEAFIMRDDENLYVAFLCRESRMGQLKAAIKEKYGSVWEDDDVEFFISVGQEPRDYHQFIVNSIGAQYDNGKKDDWKARAAAGSGAWSVEMAIPFDHLGIKPEGGMICRGHFCRGQKPKGERSAWPRITSPSFSDLFNSARIVFGSYKAVALRKIEDLIKRTEGLSGSDALAGEKAGILDEARKLAAKVNGKDALSINEFQEIAGQTAGIEDQKTALEAKIVRERFASVSGAPGTSNAFLTSETSRNGYDLPEVWSTRQILGKDFWFNMRHTGFQWKEAGLEDEAFVKDSLMHLPAGRFEYDFFDPQSGIYQMLKKTNRPFTVFGQDDLGKAGFPPSVCRRFLKEYGHRFAGFIAEECFGTKARQVIWEAMGLQWPRTRHEAFLGFLAAYFDTTYNAYNGLRGATSRAGQPYCFRSWALTQPEFRPWTSCGTATYLDHSILELGAPFTGEEIGQQRGYSMHLGMCYAFSRGAAI